MKQIWIQRSGGPEVLTLRDAPDPTPGPGDVLIDVAAAGVNFADVLARMGMYPDAPPLPAVVGYEVAGTVRDVGAGVTGITAGREVVALTRFGGYSDVVSVPEAQVFLKPAGMSFSEAAAVPVNYLTAALALFRFGSLQAGETVLVQNAGGGVGIAATQLAKSRGATVYGTASAWKHEELSRLGVDHSIDYRHEDVISAVNDLTGGRGVDIILDPIGGSSLKRDMEILAPWAASSPSVSPNPCATAGVRSSPSWRRRSGCPVPASSPSSGRITASRVSISGISGANCRGCGV
jgi:NADPH:quinone reductase-like Zn-dependent oxidoreductase